ncbi:MAG: acetyl-CoA carboxylase biotin carboxylase subunit [Rubrivivax sp.]|nr:acetyl-CoA carboxylase biotin carboxylase subunit [Rubrivivax sp.]
MTITTILVANRGEIACRVIRTARSLGLRSVAVYTEADRRAPHVAAADEAVCIGAGPAGESYLSIEKILDAARATAADAVHPGYGFLAENAAFAEAVEAAGLVFIGPTPTAIRDMGNKAAAKRLMIAAAVPCVPGYEGRDQSDAAFVAAAGRIGYPVMVKAAAGGGGRGMRLVDDPVDLPTALNLARAEAANAFGSDELILEKAILRPRHVELQIFADTHGNCIYLGERDCSVQRRHQKVVEEAPCPVMTPELRAAMGQAAVSAARSVHYRGAGTVEFLLDDSGSFYFLEMNTRLQVEHPVTELITGLDLVALQIAVADGEPLPLTQEQVRLDGHAIEVRLYAEDPANDFLPATGHIDLWQPAQGDGVRIDAGVVQGQEVSPFYDAMLAKVIAWGPTREVARARLANALEDTVLFGPVTNTAFLVDVVRRERFARGEATTAFLAEEFPAGISPPAPTEPDLALAAALILRAGQARAVAAAGYVSATQLGWSSSPQLPIPIDLTSGDGLWSLHARARGQDWQISVGERTIEVVFESIEPHRVTARVGGRRVRAAMAAPDAGSLWLAVDGRRLHLRVKTAGADAHQAAGGRIVAPMPGVLIAVEASPGQPVARGDVVAVLEAMKMQYQIVAPVDGTVAAVAVARGQQIAAGDLMIDIREDAELA